MSRFRHLIREIHRRSLWQVVGVYMGASWVALQVVHHVTAAAALPDWVPSFALVLLLLFFPVVLATAFVQEGTAAARGEGRREARSGAGGTAEREPRPGEPRPPGPQQREGEAGVPEPREAAGRELPAADAAGEREAPSAAHRIFTWRNAGVGLAGGFVLIVLLVGAWFATRALGIGPAATLVAQGVMEERERVVLADFGNATPDPTLGDVVTEALRIDLTRSPVVTVVDGAYVSRVLERMRRDATAELDAATAREVALREGFGIVLAGEVAPLGGGYLLSARLSAAADGREIAAFRQTARDASELIDAVDRLSREIRERIGESLRSVRRGEPLDRVSTSSLEALQKYTQSVRVREREADDRRAAALLEEAIELDPEFAMAWRKLGVTTPDRSRQVEALERAYALRDRLPDRERYMAEGSYLSLVAGRHHDAVLAYRALLELYPDDVAAMNNLALIYWNHLGHPEEATELLHRANRIQPSSIQYVNLVLATYQIEGPAAAWRILDEARALYPENLMLNFQHPWLLATAEGEYARADSIARRLAAALPGNPEARGMSLNMLARVAAIRGQVAAARSHVAPLAAMAAELGRRALALGGLAELASLEAVLLPDPDRAIRRLEEELRRYPLEEMPALDRPYLVLARAYAAAGRGEEALAWLAADEEASPDPGALYRADRDLTRAIVYALPGSGVSSEELGAAWEVVAAMPRTGSLPPFDLWIAARYWESQGEADSALVAYRRYLEDRSPTRAFSDAHLLGIMLERVAELHAERGEFDEAAAALDRLDGLWAEADPPVRARVERARAALAAGEARASVSGG